MNDSQKHEQRCIAIVDDDHMVLRALRRLLHAIGYRVECYSSGAELLRSVADVRPACVILDVNMPDLDGFEVQHLLSRNDYRTAVILITGQYDELVAARAAASGAIACLPKPLDESLLLDLLADVEVAGPSRQRDVAVGVTTAITGAPKKILCAIQDREEFQGLQRVLDMRQVVGIREAWREVSLAGGLDAYIISYGVADLAAITVCRDIRRLDPHGPICFYVDVEESVHRSRAIEAGADSYVLRENGPEVLRDELQRLLLRADADAISAKVAEAAAIEEELNRRAALARERVQHAQQRSADAAARMVQAKAMRAFFEAKGSRAAFERYWPNVFDTAYRKIHPGQ